MAVEEATTIERDAFDGLLAAIAGRGYEVIGPTVRDGAIVYDSVATSDDLPIGWTDEQDGGTYRLRRRDDEALFGYAVGPQSWKRLLHPPEVRLWRAARDADGAIEIEDDADDAAGLRVRRRALLRAARDRDPGPGDDRRRLPRSASTPPAARGPSSSPSTAVEAGGTCFCVSMETGPRAESGYDLALTEVIEGDAPLLPRRGRQRRAAPRCSPRSAQAPADAAEVEAAAAGDRRARPPTRAARWTPPESRSSSTTTTSIRAGTRSPSAA